MSAPYCSRCIETWNIKGTETVTLGHWVNAIPGLSLHVACGRALEAIRTRPRKCWCGRPVPASSLDGINCAEHDSEVAA